MPTTKERIELEQKLREQYNLARLANLYRNAITVRDTLDSIILATPTSELRNKLTEANGHLIDAIEILEKPT